MRLQGYSVLYVTEKNETVNADRYSSELDVFNTEIQRKCPFLANRKGVIIQIDNSRPLVATQTAQKIADFTSPPIFI